MSNWPNVIAALMAAVVCIALVAWTVREVPRAREAERQWRLEQFVANSPEMAKIGAAFREMQEAVAVAMAPALQASIAALADLANAFDKEKR